MTFFPPSNMEYSVRFPMSRKVATVLEYDSRANTSWSPNMRAGAGPGGNDFSTEDPVPMSVTLRLHCPDTRKIEIEMFARGLISGLLELSTHRYEGEPELAPFTDQAKPYQSVLFGKAPAAACRTLPSLVITDRIA
jgi:hypothetical protein